MMKVMFLGSGEAFDRIHNVSILINNEILLECGPHTLKQLMKSDVDIKEIKIIYLSHFHADHSIGVPSFLLASAEEGRSEKLTIIGPKGIKDYLVDALWITYRKKLEDIPFKVVLREIEKNPSLELLGYRFSFGQTKHSMPCYSLSIEKDKRKITYTGDGEHTKETFSIAKGSHLLISEAYGERFKMHSSPCKAAELARATKSKLLALVHTHRKCPFEEIKIATSIFSPILLPQEFDIIIL